MADKCAVEMGRKGGQAGTGAAKRRAPHGGAKGGFRGKHPSARSKRKT
jgi:hypothetical protein